jgi:hypothetical protein
MFPSVYIILKGQRDEMSSPCLVVNPNLRKTISDEEFLQMMDSLSQKVINKPFLAKDVEDKDIGLTPIVDEMENQQSFYEILLATLQFAIYRSFQQQLTTTSTSNATLHSSLDTRRALVEELLLQSTEMAINPTKLQEITAPFLEACASKLKHATVETLLLTPILYVQTIDFEAIDQACKGALNRVMEELCPTKNDLDQHFYSDNPVARQIESKQNHVHYQLQNHSQSMQYQGYNYLPQQGYHHLQHYGYNQLQHQDCNFGAQLDVYEHPQNSFDSATANNELCDHDQFKKKKKHKKKKVRCQSLRNPADLTACNSMNSFLFLLNKGRKNSNAEASMASSGETTTLAGNTSARHQHDHYQSSPHEQRVHRLKAPPPPSLSAFLPVQLPRVVSTQTVASIKPIPTQFIDSEYTEVPSVQSGRSVASLHVSNGKVDHPVSHTIDDSTQASTRSSLEGNKDENETSKSSANKKGDEDDGHLWETVELRVRNSRKKTTSNGTIDPIAQGLVKRAPRKLTRRKNNTRRMVNEVLDSLLDTVDDEVRRRNQHVVPKKSPVMALASSNPWKIGPPKSTGVAPLNSSVPVVAKPIPSKKVSAPVTMRDIVVGRHATTSPNKTGAKEEIRPAAWLSVKPKTDDSSSQIKESFTKLGKSSSAADQNTAPTYQETVSAVSGSAAPKESPTSIEDRVSKDESSSSITNEISQNLVREEVILEAKSSELPLPTLLNPQNVSSANSSVASSLEVSHAGRHNHRFVSGVDVNDVGYHLLDVCDRLTRDMGLFMSRRALALTARRRERGALLSALQNSVSSIWPSRGHVEMYGSCATQLDLPSSDIDVVVVGLDRNMPMEMMASPSLQDLSLAASIASVAPGPSQSFEEVATDDSFRSTALPPHMAMQLPTYDPLQMHRMISADRVVRLGAELEAQPWAVQVNAIPTATVPVIKVLADPSKLTSHHAGGEWMAHHQQLAAQAAAAAVQPEPSSDKPRANKHQYAVQSQPFHPPWRGADVMNGLLSLDITFEGAGHGGIGSTQFSAQVVADESNAAAVHPDATALVQVVMVLKELLAQRKLNEPYSGGLSSYAVLLLVVSLCRERAIIREEIERAERQRRAMTAGDGVGTFVNLTSQVAPVNATNIRPQNGTNHKSVRPPQHSKTLSSKASTLSNSLKKDSNHSTKPSNGVVASSSNSSTGGSSWACIAKKKNSASSSSGVKLQAAPVKDDAVQAQRKQPTFADAARSAPHMQTSSTPMRSYKSSLAGQGPTTKGSLLNETNAELRSRKASNNSESSETDRKSVGATSAPVQDASPLPASFYPQGYNDVIEVLCSGEPTAGKLLMHFFLYYGQYFDSQSTAIDLSGKHERDYSGQVSPYYYFSPFISRTTAGLIDPVTGMLTVDPIVIYDPLEGSESNNVARRCFAWNSVRWIFAQSYATLSSAVERSATPPVTPAAKSSAVAPSAAGNGAPNSEVVGDLMDPSTPLLSCLLSF